jgi:hypothetical protein
MPDKSTLSNLQACANQYKPTPDKPMLSNLPNKRDDMKSTIPVSDNMSH